MNITQLINVCLSTAELEDTVSEDYGKNYSYRAVARAVSKAKGKHKKQLNFIKRSRQ